MPGRVLQCLLLIPIFMLLVSSCNQSTRLAPSGIIAVTSSPSPTVTQTVVISTITPTMTAVSTPKSFAAPTPTILQTPTDPTDHIWDDLLFGPCEICELEPANVKVNSNGFSIIGKEKDMQRWVLILDESQSSPERTYLIVEITRHKSVEQAKEYSIQRKSQLTDEHFTDLQTKEINQFPEDTWMMQQDRRVVMLGSTYKQFELIIYLKTYLAPKEEPIHPFANLDSAARVVVVAAQAQFKNFKDVLP